ncbi:uncharacterized protein BP01DRAFT_378891 [Aspergillus saccharolyticus JOP 1030-1]|uniref:DUF6604 domain-containing protein n=1 Tax=Aspergillus saccharolyticus JOP 1030-1 TaxID=1450539 RepID=A0A318ZRM1_9EURO|nr:hypothetical protein BP01DRAFT_378891 [Aspergillus saccharolyticus JOP 1030-1]PYH49325.1 hypothetical protein BP01DRAFT_378891 [Aspergillus saccharolyticus JOP 1030-1]
MSSSTATASRASSTYMTIYHQYKKTFGVVVTWLVVADRDCKRYAAGDTELGMCQLVGLARNIVERKYADRVPLAALQSLRWLLEIRAARDRFFSRDGDSEVSRRHWECFRNLVAIYQTLKPIIPDIEWEDYGSVEMEERITRIYGEDLDVPVESIAGLQVRIPINEYLDARFTVILVLEDLWSIRDRVVRAWTEYRDGGFVQLEAPSLITDSGMDIAQHLLRYALGHLDEAHQVWNPGNSDLNLILDEILIRGDQDARGWHHMLKDWQFINVALRDLMTRWDWRGEDDTLLHRLPPDLDFSEPPEQMTDTDRCTMVALLLEEFIRERSLYDRMHPTDNHGVVDSLSFLWKRALDAGSVNLELIFAAYLYVEVRQVMGKEVGQAFAQYQKWADSAMKQIESLVKLGKPPGELEDVLMEIRNVVWKDNVNIKRMWLGLPAQRRFGFFSCHPYSCGQIYWYYRTKLYRTFLDLATDSCALLGMIHLYNAAACENALPTGWTWPELEQLIRLHTPMFMGGKPPTERSSYAPSLTFSCQERERRRPWVPHGDVPIMTEIFRMLDEEGGNPARIDRIISVSQSVAAGQRAMRRWPSVGVVLSQLLDNLNSEVSVLDMPWFQYLHDSMKIYMHLYEQIKDVRRSPEMTGEERPVGVAFAVLKHRHQVRLLRKAGVIMKQVVGPN